MTDAYNHSDAIREMIWVSRAIRYVPTGEVLFGGSKHSGVNAAQIAGQTG